MFLSVFLGMKTTSECNLDEDICHTRITEALPVHTISDVLMMTNYTYIIYS